MATISRREEALTCLTLAGGQRDKETPSRQWRRPSARQYFRWRGLPSSHFSAAAALVLLVLAFSPSVTHARATLEESPLALQERVARTVAEMIYTGEGDEDGEEAISLSLSPPSSPSSEREEVDYGEEVEDIFPSSDR